MKLTTELSQKVRGKPSRSPPGPAGKVAAGQACLHRPRRVSPCESKGPGSIFPIFEPTQTQTLPAGIIEPCSFAHLTSTVVMSR